MTVLPEKLRSQLDFITEIDKMKTVFRRTLIMTPTDVPGGRHENDAEHSWHIAMMAMTLAEYAVRPVDLARVVPMCLVHDLVEVYAGDTFAYDKAGNATKEAREKAAADRLFGMLPEEQGARFRALWEEFDAEETDDALFAAAVDRLQPLMCNRLTEGHTWVEHDVAAEDILRRNEPVRKMLPALWDYVLESVEFGKKTGYIKK